MKLKVTIDINKINKDRWSSFVYDHPNGNIFQTPEMYEVYKQTKNYEPIFLAVTANNDEILGILLAVIQKEYSGFLGNFTARSIIFGGPLIKDNDQNILDLILKEYNNIIKRKAIYSQFRNMWEWGELKDIFIKNGFEYEEHLNIIIDLNNSEKEIFENISKSRRKHILKGSKNGFNFSEGDYDSIDKFYILLQKSYKRIGLPIPSLQYFYNLINEFGDKCRILSLENDDGTVIVSGLGLIYKEEYLAFYIGRTDDKEILRKNPIDYYNWKRLQWAKENGIKRFNWFGAGKPNIKSGVRDYKETFGGKIENQGRFEKVHKPFLMKIGKTGLKVWQKIK